MSNISLYNNEIGCVSTCQTCKWQSTSVCPKSKLFIGLHTDESWRHPSICSRYHATNEENDRRQQQLLDKLSSNL